MRRFPVTDAESGHYEHLRQRSAAARLEGKSDEHPGRRRQDGYGSPFGGLRIPASGRFDPQPQRRTNEGSWLAGSGARRGWPLAAFSPDAPGAQAPGKGGSGLERGAAAGQEGSWGRVRGAVESSHETSQQRGGRKLIFWHIGAYTTRSSHG